MKFLLLNLLLIVSASMSAQKKFKNQKMNLEKIVGSWTLIKSEKSQTIFTKTEEADYFSKHLMASYTYILSGDTLIARDKKDGEIYKYLIVLITSNNLTLKLIKTGYLVAYRRTK